MTEFHERFDRSGSVPGALREAQEAFRLRDRAGHLAAYGRMVARAGRAAAELGDETLAEHVADARHLLEDERGTAWDWADDGGHPRHWAGFVAVAAP
ncbi:hypothetical protein [Streptosporangium sp. V21-05]|uniref:hypothetical protein n=1 Tax=Streptosporangium sp. V21-05 TaxID=3446115 RepID=UPI003F53AF7C